MGCWLLVVAVCRYQLLWYIYVLLIVRCWCLLVVGCCSLVVTCRLLLLFGFVRHCCLLGVFCGCMFVVCGGMLFVVACCFLFVVFVSGVLLGGCVWFVFC